MLVEPLKDNCEWETFLQTAPESTFYHSLNWKKVIEKSFPVRTHYFTVRNSDGRLVGICPACVLTEGNARVLESLPFSDFGGPVVEKRYQVQACVSLYRAIDEFCHRNRISFAQMCFIRDGCEKLFKSSRCYIDDSKGVVHLDLASIPSDRVWNVLGSKQRQKIRKLEKNGFEVREAASKEDLKKFLGLYYKNMRYLGVASHGPHFFENLWDLLYPRNFTILLAGVKAAVGGVAFFQYAKTIYLTYLGMDRDSLQHTPAIAPFLYWKAIEWAEKNGFTTVYFGSTPVPKSMQEDVNYSQKMAFGGSFHPQDTIYLPFNFHSSVTFLVDQKATGAWRSMRNVWPPRLQGVIEHRLRRMFERARA
jgi:hypothetical protein